MKRTFILALITFSVLLNNCKAEKPSGAGTNAPESTVVVQLTNETFKKMVFDYDLNKVWKYEGNKPAIIDFYADWCAPCRQLSPLVDEIAKEYAGKIVVYKVDTEKERILAQSMGISGLPTLIFIPVKGDPRLSMGLVPKADLVKAINEVLLIK